MIRRLLKEAWEMLCIALLGVPMMLVGYFAAFMVNGFKAGQFFYRAVHGRDEDEQ